VVIFCGTKKGLATGVPMAHLSLYGQSGAGPDPAAYNGLPTAAAPHLHAAGQPLAKQAEN